LRSYFSQVGELIGLLNIDKSAISAYMTGVLITNCSSSFRPHVCR